MTEPLPRAGGAPRGAHAVACRVCGVSLTPGQAVRGICDSAECRRGDVAHQLRLRDQALAEAARRQAAGAVFARPVMALPDGMRPITLLPAERRERFTAGLDALLQAVFAERAAPQLESTPSRNGLAKEDAQLALLGSACALCGGFCCHTGGDSAWLEVATLQRVAAANPALSAQEVRAAYLDRLPERHVADSCVYHGERGCNLPRELRSSTCNGYICADLAALVGGWRAAGGSCLAAARRGAAVQRVALLDGQSVVVLAKPARDAD